MSRVLAALVAFVLLAACGGGADRATDQAADSPAASSAATPDEEATSEAASEESDVRLDELYTMKIANVPYFGPEYIAADQGFDTEYNLEFEMIQATALGVPGVQAAAAGQVDTFQSVAYDSWYKSIAAGVDLVGILSGQVSGGEFDVYRYYVRADSGIDGAEDLAGLRMGIVAPGSYGDVPMDLYLKEAGLQPGDVERVAVPGPEIPNALLNGQIDIAAVYSTLYAELEAEHADEVTLLLKDTDVEPSDQFITAYGFTRQFIEEHPDRIRAYVAAMQDAVAFIEENPEEAKAIIAETTGSPIEGLIVPTYPEDLCMDLSLLESYEDSLIELGYVEEGAIEDISSHFTNEYNPACE